MIVVRKARHQFYTVIPNTAHARKHIRNLPGNLKAVLHPTVMKIRHDMQTDLTIPTITAQASALQRRSQNLTELHEHSRTLPGSILIDKSHILVPHVHMLGKTLREQGILNRVKTFKSYHIPKFLKVNNHEFKFRKFFNSPFLVHKSV